MASIDQYKHSVLDFIVCPAEFDFVYKNSTRVIAIYLLNQDISKEETRFDGYTGDLIVGGGAGEAESLRISTRSALHFFKGKEGEFENMDELFKCFWSPTFSFIIGSGCLKLGWRPPVILEKWLAEYVLNQLLRKQLIQIE